MLWSLILASSLVFLPLNTAADDFDTTIPPVYKKAGDTVVLSPGPVVDPITSILWKHGADIAMEWFHGTTSSYQQFEARGFLNNSTGELTIRGLTRNDSGIYTSEINDQVTNTTEFLVISPVSKPTVSTLCKEKESHCVLTCEGNTSGVEQITYMWSTGGETWESSQEQFITWGEWDPWYSCELHNPVSSETSEQVFNPVLSRFLGLILFLISVVLTSCTFALTRKLIYKIIRGRVILGVIFTCLSSVGMILCLVFLTYESIYKSHIAVGISGVIVFFVSLVGMILSLFFLPYLLIYILIRNSTAETYFKRKIEEETYLKWKIEETFRTWMTQGKKRLIIICVSLVILIVVIVSVTYKYMNNSTPVTESENNCVIRAEYVNYKLNTSKSCRDNLPFCVRILAVILTCVLLVQLSLWLVFLTYMYKRRRDLAKTLMQLIKEWIGQHNQNNQGTSVVSQHTNNATEMSALMSRDQETPNQVRPVDNQESR